MIAEDPFPRAGVRTVRAITRGTDTVYLLDASFRYGIFYRIESVRGEDSVTIETFGGPRAPAD
jgi:hypothetical protein